MPTVVLDCNILVICLTSRSPYHLIYRALIEGRFNLAVSIEILLEYEEIIQQKYGVRTAQAFISLLKELPNVHFYHLFYNWLLIQSDVDDNKYCDCYIASRSSYLVTEDNHFSILKEIPFPKVNVFSIDDFMKILSSDTDH